MKFVKMVALLLAALLGLSACQGQVTPPADGDVAEVTEWMDLAGKVVTVEDGYILIETKDHGQVQVNVSDATVYEGDAVAAGDYIHVTYDGKMTRSLPPQVSAVKVGCYVRVGVIAELTEEGFMLQGEGEEIRVNAEKTLLEGLEEGQKVAVYFSGAMTMSLPAQIGAEAIVVR